MRVSVEEAARLLHNCQPVAVATETVWGLAARACDPIGVEKIFELKGRPLSNPLIVHICDQDMLAEYVSFFPEETRSLIERFWPGPLTMVLPVFEQKIPSIVRAGRSSVAFRFPINEKTCALIEKVGPVVAPSANRSGSPSATCAEHVENDFGADLPILYSEHSCERGIESTIIIWKEGRWYLGRLGAVNIVDIEQMLGYSLSSSASNRPECPGQHFRHYAPQARLELCYQGWSAGLDRYDAVLGFEDRSYPGAPKVVTMGCSGSFESVEKSLYAALRELDFLGAQMVFVDCAIPSTLSWLPVWDRLKRAAQEG